MYSVENRQAATDHDHELMKRDAGWRVHTRRVWAFRRLPALRTQRAPAGHGHGRVAVSRFPCMRKAGYARQAAGAVAWQLRIRASQPGAYRARPRGGTFGGMMHCPGRRGKLQDGRYGSARYPFGIYAGTYICHKDHRPALAIAHLPMSQFRCCVDGEIAR